MAAKGKEWSYSGGNDNWGIGVGGVDGTENLIMGMGRRDVRLRMWGHPQYGVLIIYHKMGPADFRGMFSSKGDMSRLREIVYTLQDDPMPVGLFIPFDKAWLAVKEFMDTEGQLPTSIEWVRNADLPPNTFPDP